MTGLVSEKNRRFYWGIVIVLIFYTSASAVIMPNDVLVLVNDNSNTSRYIAKMYLQYYPEISQSQVLHLTDPSLKDCSGPNSTAEDEIITRTVYEQAIAQPIRDYLIANNMVNTIKVIITTAGMPYRIECSVYPNVVQPAGGYPYMPAQIYQVHAASVESDLTLLFANDPGPVNPVLGFDNRAVNPYQGYRYSGMELFERDILNNLVNMDWYPPNDEGTLEPPLMEGIWNWRESHYYGKYDRDCSVGDMYLTCRLDGPKQQGKSAVFAVRDILDNAQRASSQDYGINPSQAAIVYDDANSFIPGVPSNSNRIYNLPFGEPYIVYSPDTDQPPDTYYKYTRDDYDSGFEKMTGTSVVYNNFNIGQMLEAYDLTVICDKRSYHRTNQDDLDPEKLVVALACYGVNGDEPGGGDYIETAGPQGGPVFDLAYGAVFTSLESFNVPTTFTDVLTSYNQGQIVDFLAIGGSGAIGHTFEPYADASIDSEFFFYNLVADSDCDGFADVTFVEAAFTSIPYLSWAEVVIGDPLMRIAI